VCNGKRNCGDEDPIFIAHQFCENAEQLLHWKAVALPRRSRVPHDWPWRRNSWPAIASFRRVTPVQPHSRDCLALIAFSSIYKLGLWLGKTNRCLFRRKLHRECCVHRAMWRHLASVSRLPRP
jgi:hypothetical protein